MINFYYYPKGPHYFMPKGVIGDTNPHELEPPPRGLVKSELHKPDTFLYFAYGSNLLKEVIHLTAPSAKFASIGRLDNYRLQFIKYCHFWGGPTITMVPTANGQLWGAIWRIHKNDKISLDTDNWVDLRQYFSLTVPIQTPHMGVVMCRTYQQRINPLPRADNDEIPVENWPSKVYLRVIIVGAMECRLPEYYIEWLLSLPHNGEEGCLLMAELLRRYANNPVCECRWPGRILREPLKLDLNKCRQTTKEEQKEDAQIENVHFENVQTENVQYHEYSENEDLQNEGIEE